MTPWGVVVSKALEIERETAKLEVSREEEAKEHASERRTVSSALFVFATMDCSNVGAAEQDPSHQKSSSTLSISSQQHTTIRFASWWCRAALAENTRGVSTEEIRIPFRKKSRPHSSIDRSLPSTPHRALDADDSLLYKSLLSSS